MKKWEYCHVIVTGIVGDTDSRQYRVYKLDSNGYEKRIAIYRSADTLGVAGVIAGLGEMGWEMASGPLPEDRRDLIAYFKRPLEE